MHEVHLESLAFGGDAVGRLGGKVVLVPFGAPGDRARIRILKETASLLRGEILSLLEPGPGRRAPPCAHFGACGGCQWQHLAYDRQAASKEEIFRRAMAGAEVPEVWPLLAAPRELGYRRRVRMHWMVRPRGAELGYFRPHSRELLDVEACPLLVAPLEEAVRRCRDGLASLPRGARGSVVGLAGAMGEVQVSWRLEAGDGDAARRLVAHPFGAPVVGGMVQTQGGRLPFGDGAVNLAEEGSSPVWASAAAFAQANAEQDSALRRCVAEWAEPRQARVLELFAGVGNLTRGLAGEAREVVAVESSPVASDILERNAAVMGGTVRVLTGEAEAVLQGLVDRGERFEIVVLDPPREGCPSLAPLLAKLGASRVVYVSCDPMTLARDLRLLAREGFRTARARAVDMMPQTFHVEGLALASR